MSAKERIPILIHAPFIKTFHIYILTTCATAPNRISGEIDPFQTYAASVFTVIALRCTLAEAIKGPGAPKRTAACATAACGSTGVEEPKDDGVLLPEEAVESVEMDSDPV